MTERREIPLPFTQTGNGANALVFIHGFLDDASFWRSTNEALEARNLSVVTLDLPGMGKAADDPGPFSLDRLAQTVASVVDAVGRPTVLVGHSMGARIAELVARMRPRQIAGLVLLTPVALGGTAVPEASATAFRSLGSNPKGQRELRIQSSSHLTASDLDHAVEVGARVRPATVTALFDAWSGGHDAGLVPSVVDVPVLILYGVDGPFVTRELVTTTIFPRFGRARIASISNAGHWPHLEQPAATATAIDSFLAEIGWHRPDGTIPTGRETTVAKYVAGNADEQPWTDAFEKRSTEGFEVALAPGAVLNASALIKPIVGRDFVKICMGTASTKYEHLVFLAPAARGATQILGRTWPKDRRQIDASHFYRFAE
jgi:pimeloyl-ACP methyl ester carboxylesterase